jgi:zinc-binding alcohol dehydrogenase/oxidoreductase
VRGWIGKEVIINPAMNWGGHAAYQDPTSFSILGLPEDGTLAEFVKVPIANLAEKPTHLSFEEAAALPLAGTTAYRASMTRAQIRSGEKVLITGIGGGVALFALQFALAAGARVYVTSGSDEKISKAVTMGAFGGVNYKSDNWVGTMRDLAGGFDVTIDGAAGDGMGDLFDLALPGGRVVFYGATRGNPSNLVARRIFWKQLNVLGSTMGSPADFAGMVGLVKEKKIRPVVEEVFDFEHGEAAFRLMDSAGQFGKIVVKIR